MAALNVYLRKANDHTMAALRVLRMSRHKNVRLWVMRSLAQTKPFSAWRDKNVIEDGVTVIHTPTFEWDITNQLATPLDYQLSCLIWHHTHNDMDFCILDDTLPAKRQIVVFEDSLNDKAMPDRFFKIPCFDNSDMLLNFCKDKGIVHFSLKDTNFFRHDHSCTVPKGAEVYKELATGRLWYKDTLHKNHYEIFEPTGRRHIGEADMNGIVDFSKADSTKLPIK